MEVNCCTNVRQVGKPWCRARRTASRPSRAASRERSARFETGESEFAVVTLARATRFLLAVRVALIAPWSIAEAPVARSTP